MMETVNCNRCYYKHEDNGNCTAVGGFCTAVPAAHCPLLREYLAAGLMPDEIVKMGMAYEDSKRYSGRLELKLRPYLDIGISPAELAKAVKDGRLVVLPCKVGEKLYRVIDGNILEHQVQNMRYFARQGRLGIDTTPFFPDAEKSIGKTVFLTREEAEKALEGMRNG